MIINNLIYTVHWDPDDCRFSCYDNSVWDSEEAAIAKIYEWCEKHKTHLQPVMDSDGFKGSFEAWVAWCIKEFCHLKFQGVYGYLHPPADEDFPN